MDIEFLPSRRSQFGKGRGKVVGQAHKHTVGCDVIGAMGGDKGPQGEGTDRELNPDLGGRDGLSAQLS